jgi:hypothetical protein
MCYHTGHLIVLDSRQDGGVAAFCVLDYEPNVTRRFYC